MEACRVAILAALVLASCARGLAESLPAAVAELTFTEDIVFGAEVVDDAVGRFGAVADLAIDSRGVVHVLDRGFHRVHRYSASGEFLGQYGAEGEGPGDFRQPHTIAVGPDDRIYVGGNGSLIAVFTADGTPLAPIPRSASTFGQPVRSIGVDAAGHLYVCAADLTSHTMIHKHDASDHSLLLSFCDTYAVGHGVEPRVESTFSGGFVAVAPDGHLLYAQLAPPDIRLFDLGGRLIRRIPTWGSDAGIPAAEIDGDRITFHSPAMLSGRIVALSEGRFLATVLVPRREGPYRTSFQGSVHVDLFEISGQRMGYAHFERQFFPLAADDEGLVYVSEVRDTDGHEIPVVVRYRLQ